MAMNHIRFRSGLSAILSLAVFVLLLSLYFTSLKQPGGNIRSRKRSAAIHAGDGQSPAHVPPAYNLSTAAITGVALRFVGRPGLPLEFSKPHVRHRKRASSSLTYQSAICKGKKYYKLMRDTYAKSDEDPKNNQGTEFSNKDIDNGWSRKTVPWGDGLRQDWEGAFNLIAEETGAQPSADLTKIQLRQDTRFTSQTGNVVEVCSVSSQYCQYGTICNSGLSPYRPSISTVPPSSL